MAEIKEALASLVECPICLGDFRDPRMLTCLHTLCYQCLGDHIQHSGKNGRFQCPECRKDVVIPTGGAGAFPKNFFVNRYMDIVSESETGARSKTIVSRCTSSNHENLCHLCEEDEPSQFCTQCCEYYCVACSKGHSKSRVSRSHQQVAVEDLTDEMLRAAMSEIETPRCLKHDMKFNLYCGTCQCAACPACCQVSHQSHIIRDIADVDREVQTELREAKTALQHLTSNTKARRERVDRVHEHLTSNSPSPSAVVEEVFQGIQKMLGEKAKEVGLKIDKIIQDRVAEVDIEAKNLTLNSQLQESLLSFTDDLLKKGSTFNRLACLPEVRSRLQQFQSTAHSAGAATELTTLNSADLLAKQLDGSRLVLKHEIKLGTRGSFGPETGLTLEILVKCSIRQAEAKMATCTVDRPGVGDRAERWEQQQQQRRRLQEAQQQELQEAQPWLIEAKRRHQKVMRQLEAHSRLKDLQHQE